MNEGLSRFAPLAEQAEQYADEAFNSDPSSCDNPGWTKAWRESMLKKFAELLIREAAQFVSGSAEVYTQAEQDACVRAAIGLKTYFGVEE